MPDLSKLGVTTVDLDRRYVPRVRTRGRCPFRTGSWQVWDTHRNEWAPNALCGGALTAAMAASEGLNRG